MSNNPRLVVHSETRYHTERIEAQSVAPLPEVHISVNEDVPPPYSPRFEV